MSRGEHVGVYVRLRPSANPTSELLVSPDARRISVSLAHPPGLGAGAGVPGGVNNQPAAWGPFAMERVFEASTSQGEVYDEVARDVVEHVLQGYNGTILAYGETGSGKTYTMTGPSSSYDERGITPRAISHLFRLIDACAGDMRIETRVSYAEIYNDHIFDLLAPRPPPHERNPSMPLQVDLPIQEDAQSGAITVKGLGLHVVSNEQECMDALFVGDSARSVGAHTLNPLSTRSHTVYTLYLSMRSRVQSSEKVLQAKLHLVDLAGSERVGKTDSRGLVLTEAKAINKSLSFLEQCVVALSSGKARAAGHVPFRSSRLTHLLKDSLGGNTRTRLVACLHSDAANLMESLATLKFASRMRRVTNHLSLARNTSLDPSALIARLQREVKELKQELAMHDVLANRIGISYEPYAPEESVALRREIARYCSGAQEELEIVNLRQVREAFRQFKNYVLEIQGQLPPGAAGFRTGASNPATARQTPEPSSRPGSASANASHMVGEMDESAGGGFGVGIVSSYSRPAPRADARDEPLRPSNIIKSRARAAAAAGQTQQLRVNQSAPSSQQLSASSSSFAVQSSPKSAFGQSAARGEEKSNGSTLPALRTASYGANAPTAAFSPSRSASNTSFSATFQPSGNNATAEAAAFAEFKAGPGFDSAELCAGAKAEWTARRRELRQASLRVNDLKRRIDALSAPAAARRAEREAAAVANGAAGVEVLDESEYALLQELSAAKSEYKRAYAERLDVEAAALEAERALQDVRGELFAQFRVWFREQYGVEPSTSIGGEGQGHEQQQQQMSPRAAERLVRLGRSARAAAAAEEEAQFLASLEPLDQEARTFLLAARNRERHARKADQALGDKGRRPYVGAAFK